MTKTALKIEPGMILVYQPPCTLGQEDADRVRKGIEKQVRKALNLNKLANVPVGILIMGRDDKLEALSCREKVVCEPEEYAVDLNPKVAKGMAGNLADILAIRLVTHPFMDYEVDWTWDELWAFIDSLKKMAENKQSTSKQKSDDGFHRVKPAIEKLYEKPIASLNDYGSIPDEIWAIKHKINEIIDQVAK